jgi:hypothetical protein
MMMIQSTMYAKSTAACDPVFGETRKKAPSANRTKTRRSPAKVKPESSLPNTVTPQTPENTSSAPVPVPSWVNQFIDMLPVPVRKYGPAISMLLTAVTLIAAPLIASHFKDMQAEQATLRAKVYALNESFKTMEQIGFTQPSMARLLRSQAQCLKKEADKLEQPLSKP